MSPTSVDFNPRYYLIFGFIFLLALACSAMLYALRGKTLREARDKKLMSPEIFALFASVYAFFLGFSIVTLWGTFVSTKALVASEAAAVLSSARLSMPLENSIDFRRALSGYSASVVNDEWPLMAKNDQMSEKSSALFAQAWEAYYAMSRENGASPLYARVGQQLADAGSFRIARAQNLSGNLYPPVWIILALGVAGVLVGLLLTNPEQRRPQVIMEVIVAFLIFSCVYFILDIDTPFSGVLNVTPWPFQDVLTRIPGL